jgi:hypothetical protein
MTLRKAGIAAGLALLAAAAASWWWMRPERQIQAILDDVAAAFTHEVKDSGLEALAAVAALRPHLAPTVTIERPGAAPIEGREGAITAGARVRAASARLRVRFFDPEMMFSGDSSATMIVTSQVATGTESGQDLIDIYRVTATLQRIANRWVVSNAHIAPGAGD